MARLTKRERAIKLCRSIGCPAVDTAVGCGYVEVGTECRNSRYRDAWKRKERDEDPEGPGAVTAI